MFVLRLKAELITSTENGMKNIDFHNPPPTQHAFCAHKEMGTAEHRLAGATVGLHTVLFHLGKVLDS